MIYLDPFEIYSRTLFIALALYTAVTVAMTVYSLAVQLSGEDPTRRFLRVYLSYNIVAMRVRPLLGELAQLAFWTAVLVLLWWLHRRM